MRAILLLVGLLLATPAYADCTASFDPGSTNQGQGVGGRPPSVTLNGCASQGDIVNVTNNNFDSRFTDIQNQITINRNEARAGIAMAMAAGAMNLGGAVGAAGAGKAALGVGVGNFKGITSLSGGIAYAINKRLSISSGVSVTPSANPSYGFFGGATLILN